MPDLQSAAVANGNGVAFNVLRSGTAAFQVSGTFSATVNFEATVDQTNWFTISATNVATSATTTAATTTGTYVANCAAFVLVRARISGYASGSVSVFAEAAAIGGVGSNTKRLEDCVLTAHGEFANATLTSVVLPTVTAKFVRLKARSANAGSVYLGLTGVTKGDGTVDTTSGLELAAGDDTGWIPATNLNTFFRAADNATDSILYWVFV